jgi:RNA polymerase sigma factor (sigma-70 family)
MIHAESMTPASAAPDSGAPDSGPPANDSLPVGSTPADRPAEFDRRVMAHMPMIEVMSRRYVDEPKRADFIQEALTVIFGNWQGFRNPAGDYANFTTWLRWQVRSTMTVERRRCGRESRRQKKYGADYFWQLPGYSAPNQEDAVAVADALGQVKTDRLRGILLRRAMGEELHEISEGMGVNTKRISQLEKKARGQATAEKPRWRVGGRAAA